MRLELPWKEYGSMDSQKTLNPPAPTKQLIDTYFGLLYILLQVHCIVCLFTALRSLYATQQLTTMYAVMNTPR